MYLVVVVSLTWTRTCIALTFTFYYPALKCSKSKIAPRTGGYENLDALPPLNMDSPPHAAEPDTDRVLSGGQVQRMGMEVTKASNKGKSSKSVPLDCGFTSLDSGDIEQESDSMLMEFHLQEPENYNLQVTEPGVWVIKEAGVRLPRDDATVNEDKVLLLDRIPMVAEGPLHINGRMSGHSLPSEFGVNSSSLDEGLPINGVEAMGSQYIKGSRQEESCNVQGREPSSNKFNLTAGDWLTGFESDGLDSYNNSSITAGSSLRSGVDYGDSKEMASNRSRNDAAVPDVSRKELNVGVGLRPQYGTFVKESFGNRELNLLRVASKERTPIGRRGSEIRATQSSASRDDFSFSQRNANRIRDEGEEMGPQVGVSWEAQQSRNVTDESLYDRSQRGTGMNSGPQDSWEGPSSSRRDSDQRSRRGVSSEDVNVEAFGRDGGYTEDSDNYNTPVSRKSGWLWRFSGILVGALFLCVKFPMSLEPFKNVELSRCFELSSSHLSGKGVPCGMSLWVRGAVIDFSENSDLVYCI